MSETSDIDRWVPRSMASAVKKNGWVEASVCTEAGIVEAYSQGEPDPCTILTCYVHPHRYRRQIMGVFAGSHLSRKAREFGRKCVEMARAR